MILKSGGIAAAIAVAFLSAASLPVLAQDADAAQCGTDRTIDIAEMTWPSAAALAHIHATILEEGYGCNVEIVAGDTVPTSSSMMTRGTPAIAPELWTSAIEDAWAAAIEEGLVSPTTQLVVPDHYQVGDHLFSDHDPHPTEPWSVTRILTESSNIGTIKLAQSLGKDRVDTYLRRFGLGSKTALDLPYESAGLLLPRAKWNATSIGSIPICRAAMSISVSRASDSIAQGPR